MQKIVLISGKYDPGCSSRILIFYRTHPGSSGPKKAPDPVTGSATLEGWNIVNFSLRLL
jgi:hypothetical protein